MITLGWIFTFYIFISFIIFMGTSFTMLGWITYGFMLLPFYGIVLLAWWIYVWKNRTNKAKIRLWIWCIVLLLQVSTILISPGNCYGFSQGSTCYSNLQILLGSVPKNGSSTVLHWKQVEDAFISLLNAYGVMLVVGLFSTKVKLTDSVINNK